MDLILQVAMTGVQFATVIVCAMNGHKVKNVHDSLLFLAAAGMLLRRITAYSVEQMAMLGVVDRVWLPLIISVLLFLSVTYRNAELTTICKAIDNNKRAE